MLGCTSRRARVALAREASRRYLMGPVSPARSSRAIDRGQATGAAGCCTAERAALGPREKAAQRLVDDLRRFHVAHVATASDTEPARVRDLALDGLGHS